MSGENWEEFTRKLEQVISDAFDHAFDRFVRKRPGKDAAGIKGTCGDAVSSPASSGGGPQNQSDTQNSSKVEFQVSKTESVVGITVQTHSHEGTGSELMYKNNAKVQTSPTIIQKSLARSSLVVQRGSNEKIICSRGGFATRVPQEEEGIKLGQNEKWVQGTGSGSSTRPRGIGVAMGTAKARTHAWSRISTAMKRKRKRKTKRFRVGGFDGLRVVNVISSDGSNVQGTRTELKKAGDLEADDGNAYENRNEELTSKSEMPFSSEERLNYSSFLLGRRGIG